MRQISALVRITLGVVEDSTELTPDDIKTLIGVVPVDMQEVQTLHITYTDVDTNLIVKEHNFDEEGKEG